MAWPERDNTNYSKCLYDFIKSVPKDEGILQYHQRLVHDYVIGNQLRGILINHGMGAGKTRLGIGICESLLAKYPERKVIFLSAKSLHANALQTLREYLSLEAGTPVTEAAFEEHRKRYVMVSLNASNMYEQVTRSQTVEQLDLDELNPVVSMEEESPSSVLGVNLDDSIVVVDEAHNLLNSIVNGSANSYKLYRLIMQARRIHVILMSGSVIVNDPFEVAIAYNMLTGYLDNRKSTLFPEDHTIFTRTFCPDNPDLEANPVSEDGKQLKLPTIKNREKFQNRIIGLTSTYHLSSAESKEAEALRKRFPNMNPIHIQRIPMSSRQFSAYAEARERELSEKPGPKKRARSGLAKPSGASSTYRVRSRQLSNIIYPEEALERKTNEHGRIVITKLPEKVPDYAFQVNWKDRASLAAVRPKGEEEAEGKEHVNKKTKGPTKTEASSKGKNASKSLENKSKGLEKEGKLEGLTSYSPKIFTALCNLSVHLPWIKSLEEFRAHAKQLPRPASKQLIPGPGILYSQFRESGIDMVARALQAYGFTQYPLGTSPQTPQAELMPKGPTYAIISGEIPAEQRAEYLRVYNLPENRDGKIIAMLLVTSTGAEGIDTKGTTHMHALEPYWHIARLNQFWSRAVRLGSFDHLPAERRYVQPYLYLADYPEGEDYLSESEATTDLTLYYKSLQNKYLIDSFMLAIEEVSIDCSVHHSSSDKFHCRLCSPTNRQLFLPDLASDVKTPETCQPLRESRIKAKSIKLDSVEYMYYYDEQKTLHLFEYDAATQVYQEIFSQHPDYLHLMRELKKLE